MENTKIRKRKNVKMTHYVPKFGFALWSHGGNAILDASYYQGKREYK
jgi:hypothetical protein